MTTKPAMDRRERRRLNLTTRLAEMETFVAEQGCLLRRADHGGLAEWMYAQLKRCATDPDYVHAHDEVGRICREVDASRRAAEKQRHCSERLQALRSFIVNHGRLPSLRSGDDTECALANWMQNINVPTFVGPEYDHARAQVALLRRQHGTWTKHLQEIQAFVAANGRLPTPAENPGGNRFLRRNIARLRAGRLKTEQSAEIKPLMAMRPTEARAVEWDTSCDSVEAWVAAHGCLPRRRSADPDELRLANWLNRNRQRQRAGALSASQSESITGLESSTPWQGVVS